MSFVGPIAGLRSPGATRSQHLENSSPHSAAVGSWTGAAVLALCLLLLLRAPGAASPPSVATFADLPTSLPTFLDAFRDVSDVKCPPAPAQPCSVEFALPQDSEVQFAVYRPDRHRIWYQSTYRSRGQRKVVEWPKKDQRGKPVPDGRYPFLLAIRPAASPDPRVNPFLRGTFVVQRDK